MSPPTTQTVRVSGALNDVVATNVGENGAWENASEQIRDLIRRDTEGTDEVAFDRLKAERVLAFSAPEASYMPLTAGDVIGRNRARTYRHCAHPGGCLTPPR